jgi:hypothetical protein
MKKYKVIDAIDGELYPEKITEDEIILMDKELLKNNLGFKKTELLKLYTGGDYSRDYATLYRQEYEWIMRKRFELALDEVLDEV